MDTQKEKNKTSSMYEGSIPSVVMHNIIPAMTSSLLMLVYNLADSFFIGQTHNDFMVAAVSLAMPLFLIFMSLGTLFGVGGASVISRELGMGNHERACKASSFCIWTCIGVGIVFMLIIWIFMDPILILLGTSSDTIEYTRSYLSIVTGCGVFSMMVYCYSNLIRAEGKAVAAMVGTLIGNILNIILDPIFILGMGWGISGAAVATVIGNMAGALYYIIYVATGHFSLSANIKDYTARDRIAKNVLGVGIPAAMSSFLMSISNIIANSLIASYGDMAVAAYGIAGKIRSCFAVLCIGIGQGLQPILAYHYGAGNREKFKNSMSFSLTFALIFCCVITVLCWIFTRPIVNVFLTDDNALDYGVSFTHAMLTAAWFFGIYDILQITLQAMGKAGASMIAAVSRQGIIYIPLVFIMASVGGLYGIVYAQPLAEYISLILVIILDAVTLKKFLKPQPIKK